MKSARNGIYKGEGKVNFLFLNALKYNWWSKAK